jgi:hypothetical protein
MNEPRAMPLAFYEDRPALKGVVEGDHAALCTAVPEVRDYLRDSVETILEAAPKLKGFFTITASENLTNCWSHHRGDGCPRCKDRSPAETVTGVTRAIQEGIAAAGTETDLIAWDWGWQDAWALEAIDALPEEAALMSVSEWSIPINRGGVETAVGEYSISTIGPGPRATKHWAAARERGLRTIAKIQAGNTWELASVPYIPATENVAQHAANLLESGVDGIMLGWSLGGYPSPNLAVVAAVAANAEAEGDVVDTALRQVAKARYGDANAEAMVQAWKTASAGLREFPYHGGVVYRAPLQMGPANLLWAAPTGYTSTMVGLPYDDLKGWRAVYPEDVFIGQMEKVAAGFEAAYTELRKAGAGSEDAALERALSVIEASALHYRSVARQASFVQKRDAWLNDPSPLGALALLRLAEAEREAALRLHALQSRDSRLGYEASNHYFYVPLDLAEKALNCEWVRFSIAHTKN